MSTIIDSIILFIICIASYPVQQLDAFHIMCILLLISFYCFEFIPKNNKYIIGIGILALVLCLMVPEISLFLPFYSYVFFYRKQYLPPCFALLPGILYFNQFKDCRILLLVPVMGLCSYLAYQNRKRQQLQKTVYRLRDNSVEQEMKLRQTNRQLLESQDDQIYVATLKERNRIAREIHDNVGHMLTRSILQVGALLTLCQDENIKPHLDTLKTTLNEAMNSIRNSVHDLHDESIDLKEALNNLINNFTFCPVVFHCDTSRHVPKDVKYCFLTIAKEGLNNIIKHSNATKVTITVTEHPGFYQLLIEDNGTTPSKSESNSGIGLSNMAERVSALHGIFHIHTDKGFRIFVSIPK